MALNNPNEIGYFKDKVVLITGGSRGIGFATAKIFGEQGAKVAICSRNKESLDEALEDLNNLIPDVFAGLADVRDFNQIKEMVGEVIKRYGKIDVLVNNAGVAWLGNFAEEDRESIDEIIDTNVKGVLYTTRTVLPLMIKKKRGVIINVSSGAGLRGIPLLSTYCASKFAVVGFTQSLAQEVEDIGIGVYAVCPGAVATDMQKIISGKQVGIPSEKVAENILRLAGPEPPINTGECSEIYL